MSKIDIRDVDTVNALDEVVLKAKAEGTQVTISPEWLEALIIAAEIRQDFLQEVIDHRGPDFEAQMEEAHVRRQEERIYEAERRGARWYANAVVGGFRKVESVCGRLPAYADLNPDTVVAIARGTASQTYAAHRPQPVATIIDSDRTLEEAALDQFREAWVELPNAAMSMVSGSLGVELAKRFAEQMDDVDKLNMLGLGNHAAVLTRQADAGLCIANLLVNLAEAASTRLVNE